MSETNYYLVYISPNGSTGQVADELAGQLEKGGARVERLDLADPAGRDTFVEKLNNDPQACLLIGSPVYRDMAVPPVMAFINALAPTETGWAVPFVTWGLVTSGVALWQMGGALAEKGFRLAGAARVGALHSMMWTADDPAGKGRPDEADRQLVRDLADRLISAAAAGTFKTMALETLDYQPKEKAEEFKAKLDKPWMVIPKTIDEAACIQCDVCVEGCPAGALSLDPYPVFGKACFDCFTCVRICPEAAIIPAAPAEKIAEKVREKVAASTEQPQTEIYFGA